MKKQFDDWFSNPANLQEFYREQPDLELTRAELPSTDTIILRATPKDPTTWNPAKSEAGTRSLVSR